MRAANCPRVPCVLHEAGRHHHARGSTYLIAARTYTITRRRPDGVEYFQVSASRPPYRRLDVSTEFNSSVPSTPEWQLLWLGPFGGHTSACFDFSGDRLFGNGCRFERQRQRCHGAERLRLFALSTASPLLLWMLTRSRYPDLTKDASIQQVTGSVVLRRQSTDYISDNRRRLLRLRTGIDSSSLTPSAQAPPRPGNLYTSDYSTLVRSGILL